MVDKKKIIIPVVVIAIAGGAFGAYSYIHRDPLAGHNESYLIEDLVTDAPEEEEFTQVSPNLVLENPYTGLAEPEEYTESGVVTSSGKDDEVSKNIKIPGISSTAMGMNDALNLANPAYNGNILLQYTITEDGQTVYKTGLIESSKMVQWVASKNLGEGEHKLNAFIQGFEENETGKWRSLNAISLDFTLTLKP